PKLYVTPNNVYVTWHSNVIHSHGNDSSFGINTSVFVTHSSNHGKTFCPLRELTRPFDYGINPEIAAVGKQVVVIWENITGYGTAPAQLLIKTSSDGANTFDANPTVLDNNTYDVSGFVKPELSTFPNGSYFYASWDRSIALD